MATDHIRYDVLARDALRGVLRRVLTDAAEHGLPGEHHFYITFLSTADGVKISPRLLAQYPEEMTIILQHQFWDLVVTEDRFEVGLSFGGIPERLTVPFASVTTRSQNWCCRMMVISSGYCASSRGDSFTPSAVETKVMKK